MTNPNNTEGLIASIEVGAAIPYPKFISITMHKLMVGAIEAGLFPVPEDTTQTEHNAELLQLVNTVCNSLEIGMGTRSKAATRDAGLALNKLMEGFDNDAPAKALNEFVDRSMNSIHYRCQEMVADVIAKTQYGGDDARAARLRAMGAAPAEAAFDTVANAVDDGGNGGLTIENWHKQDAMKLAVPIVTQFVKDTYGMKPNTEGQHEVPIHVEREELIAAVRILADAKGGFFHGFDGYTVTGLRPMESDKGMMIATFQVRKFKN